MSRFICSLCHGRVEPDRPEHIHDGVTYDTVDISASLLPPGYALLVAREASELRALDTTS